MTLSNDSIQKLLRLLRPHLRDEHERRAYLMRALGMETPVLNRLVLNTPVDVFIPNMAKELVDFGKIDSGKLALCTLLEVIRDDVGLDNQASIDDLLRQLREELTEIPNVNPEMVQTTNNLPQTTDALIQQVEQYLSDPNCYIALNNLLLKEAKTLTEVMQGELEACPWEISPQNQLQCQQCIEYLEAKSERFVLIIATIVHHDQKAQFINPIAKAFKTLAKEPFSMNTYIEESRIIRLYPLALAIYAVFLVGVEEERGQLLRTVLEIRLNRETRPLPDLPLVYVLSYLDSYSRSIFNNVLGGNSYVAPVAERIKRILIPLLEEILIDANTAFYKGEFVLGLANIEAPYHLSNEKSLSLRGLYLYFPEARPILTAYLKNSSQWLFSLYPSMEELLGIFDATASKLDRGGFSRMHGFSRGALAALKEKEWY
jgi:hypothetical protein